MEEAEEAEETEKEDTEQRAEKDANKAKSRFPLVEWSGRAEVEWSGGTVERWNGGVGLVAWNSWRSSVTVARAGARRQEARVHLPIQSASCCPRGVGCEKQRPGVPGPLH